MSTTYLVSSSFLGRRRDINPSLRWLIGGAFLLVAGCTELEPMADPQAMDLQLMVSSLQGALRESERTMADLRAELDGRRQELSAVVVARAQLEGRLREVERRLTEARHIIDLQRDELLQRRSDRDPPQPESRARPSAKAKPAPKAVPVPSSIPPGIAIDPATSVPEPPLAPEPVIPAPGDQDPAVGSSIPPTSMKDVGDSSSPASGLASLAVPKVAQATEDGMSMGALLQRVAVKAGDTLYGLARRYGVTLAALRAANGLDTDRIVVGQALLVPPARQGGRP